MGKGTFDSLDKELAGEKVDQFVNDLPESSEPLNPFTGKTLQEEAKTRADEGDVLFHNPKIESAMADFENTSYMSEDNWDSYQGYNVDFSPYTNWDMQRAQNQSEWAQLGGFATQAIAGEVIGGTIEGVGYLLDVMSGQTDDEDYFVGGKVGNWLTETGVALKEGAAEFAPIYEEEPGEFNASDPAWWFKGGVSTASFVSLMIPAAGWAKGIGMVGKVAQTLSKGTKVAKALGSAGKFGKAATGMRGMERLVAAGKVAGATPKAIALGKASAAGLQMIKAAPSALAQSYMSREIESTLEATGIFAEQHQHYIEQGFSDAEARKLAGIAAAYTAKQDKKLLGLDFAQYLMTGTGFNPLKSLLGLATKSGGGAMKVIAKGIEKSSGLVSNAIVEGGEEGFQYAMGQEGKLLSEMARGRHQDETVDGFDTNLVRRIKDDYLNDAEMQNSMFFGAFGGSMFNAVQPMLDKSVQRDYAQGAKLFASGGYNTKDVKDIFARKTAYAKQVKKADLTNNDSVSKNTRMTAGAISFGGALVTGSLGAETEQMRAQLKMSPEEIVKHNESAPEGKQIGDQFGVFPAMVAMADQMQQEFDAIKDELGPNAAAEIVTAEALKRTTEVRRQESINTAQELENNLPMINSLSPEGKGIWNAQMEEKVNNETIRMLESAVSSNSLTASDLVIAKDRIKELKAEQPTLTAATVAAEAVERTPKQKRKDKAPLAETNTKEIVRGRANASVAEVQLQGLTEHQANLRNPKTATQVVNETQANEIKHMNREELNTFEVGMDGAGQMTPEIQALVDAQHKELVKEGSKADDTKREITNQASIDKARGDVNNGTNTVTSDAVDMDSNSTDNPTQTIEDQKAQPPTTEALTAAVNAADNAKDGAANEKQSPIPNAKDADKTQQPDNKFVAPASTGTSKPSASQLKWDARTTESLNAIRTAELKEDAGAVIHRVNTKGERKPMGGLQDSILTKIIASNIKSGDHTGETLYKALSLSGYEAENVENTVAYLQARINNKVVTAVNQSEAAEINAYYDEEIGLLNEAKEEAPASTGMSKVDTKKQAQIENGSQGNLETDGYFAFNNNKDHAQDAIRIENGWAMIADGVSSNKNSKPFADALLAEVAKDSVLEVEAVKVVIAEVSKKFKDAASTLAITKRNADGSFSYFTLGDSQVIVVGKDGKTKQTFAQVDKNGNIDYGSSTHAVVAGHGINGTVQTGTINLSSGERIVIASDGIIDVFQYRDSKADEMIKFYDGITSVFNQEALETIVESSFKELVEGFDGLSKGDEASKSKNAISILLSLEKAGLLYNTMATNPELINGLSLLAKGDDNSFIVLDNTFTSTTGIAKEEAPFVEVPTYPKVDYNFKQSMFTLSWLSIANNGKPDQRVKVLSEWLESPHVDNVGTTIEFQLDPNFDSANMDQVGIKAVMLDANGNPLTVDGQEVFAHLHAGDFQSATSKRTNPNFDGHRDAFKEFRNNIITNLRKGNKVKSSITDMNRGHLYEVKGEQAVALTDLQVPTGFEWKFYIANQTGLMEAKEGNKPIYGQEVKYTKGRPSFMYMSLPTANGITFPGALDIRTLNREEASTVMNLFKGLIQGKSVQDQVENVMGISGMSYSEAIDLTVMKGPRTNGYDYRLEFDPTSKVVTYGKEGLIFNEKSLEDPAQVEAFINFIIENKSYNPLAKRLGKTTLNKAKGPFTFMGVEYEANAPYTEFIKRSGMVKAPFTTRNGKFFGSPTIALDQNLKIEESAANIEATKEAVAKQEVTNDNKVTPLSTTGAIRTKRKKLRFSRANINGSPIGDAQAGKEWIRQVLPQVQTSIVDGLLAVNDKGDMANGAFSNGMIVLSNMMARGTEYHEAFHAVFHLYLSKEDQTAVLEEARGKYGTPNKADLAEAGVENESDFFEEKLADDFKLFIASEGTVKFNPQTTNLFRTLWNMIKSIFSNKTTVDMLYNRIPRGYFKESDISARIKEMSNTVRYDRVDGFTIGQTKAIADSLVSDIVDLAGVFNSEDLSSITNEHVSKEYLSKVIAGWSEEMAENVADGAISQAQAQPFINTYAKAQKHIEVIQKRVLDKFNSFNLKALEASNEFDEARAEGDMPNLKAAFESSSKDNATGNVRLLLSTLPKMDFDGYTYTSPLTGRAMLRPTSATWGVLQKNLSGLITTYDATNGVVGSAWEKMLMAMSDLAMVRPELALLVDKLSDPAYPQEKKNQFFNAFSGADMNYHTVRVKGYKPGARSFEVIQSNQQTAALQVAYEWASTFSTMMQRFNEETGKVTTKGSEVQAYKDLFDTQLAESRALARKGMGRKLSEAQDDAVTRQIETFAMQMTAMGMTLSTGTMDYYLAFDAEGQPRKGANRAEQFVEALVGTGNKHGLEFAFSVGLDQVAKGEQTMEEWATNYSVLKDLAAAEALFRDDISEAVVPGAGTATYYQYSKNNFLFKNLTELQENPEYLDRMMRIPYNTNSSALRTIKEGGKLTIEVWNNLREEKGDTGEKYTSLTPSDEMATRVNQALRGHASLLTAADKSVWYLLKGLNVSKSNTVFNQATGQYEILNKNVVNGMSSYFIDELARMKQAHSQVYGPDALAPEDQIQHYHKGNKNAFKSALFPSLSPATEGNEAVSASQAAGTKALAIYLESDNNKATWNEKIHAVLEEHVREALDARMKEDFKQALDLGLVYMENGQLMNNSLDAKILGEYAEKNPTLNKEQHIRAMIADYTVNAIKANVETTKLFTGDPAFYKNMSDFTKRVPGTIAPGQDLNIEREEDLTFDIAILNDFERPIKTQYLDQYAKALVADGIAKDDKQARQMLSPYDEVNVADAQAYITLDRYRELLKGLGQWRESEMAAPFDRLIAGGTLTSDDHLMLQPLKGMYFGLDNRRDTAMAIPTYLKYSMAPLIPAVVKGTELESMLGKMNKQGLSEVIFNSGIKVGASGQVDMDSAMLNPITLDNRSWKLQQEMGAKYIKKNSVIEPSQLIKNVLANVKMDLDYGGVLGSELVNDFINTDRALSDLGLKEFEREFGIKFNDEFDMVEGLGKGLNAKHPKLYQTLKEELKGRNAPQQVIDMLENGVPLDAIPQFRKKIQQTVLSILNKRTVKLQMPGGSFIQMAPAMFEAAGALENSDIIWLNDAKTLLPPRRGKDGKTLAGQVLLPSLALSKYQEKFPDRNLQEIAQMMRAEGLLEGVGARIPNQDLASTDYLDIVGILPAYLGDTIVTYPEITSKTGSDYDIDKMFVMLPNFRLSKDGKLSKVQYLDESVPLADRYHNKYKSEAVSKYASTIFGNIKQNKANNQDIASRIADIREERATLLAKHSGNATAMKESQEYIDLTSDITDLMAMTSNLNEKDFVNQALEFMAKEGSIPSMEEFGETPVYQQNSKEAIQNHKLDLYKELLLSKNSFARLISPIDSAWMKDQANRIREKRGKDTETTNNLAFFGAKHQFNTKQTFAGGQLGIANVANQLVDHPMTQQAGVFLDRDLGMGNKEGVDKTNKLTTADYNKIYTKAYAEAITIVPASEITALFPSVKEEKAHAYLKEELSWMFDGDSTYHYNLDYAISPENYETISGNFDSNKKETDAYFKIVGDVVNHIKGYDSKKPVKRLRAEGVASPNTGSGNTSFAGELGDNGQYITSNISAYLNAFVDIAKDPYIFDLNINTVTTNPALMLIRAGFDPEWVNALMAQPILVDFVNATMSENSKTGNPMKHTSGEKKGIRLTATEVTKLKYQLADGDKSGTLDPQALPTKEELENQIGEPDNKMQQSILTYFEDIKEIGDDFAAQVLAYKFDTKGAGKTLVEATISDNRMKSAESNFKFENVAKRMQNTMADAYYQNSVLKAKELFPQLFIGASNGVQNVMDAISGQLNATPIVSPHLATAIDNQSYSYLMQKFAPFQVHSPEKMLKIMGKRILLMKSPTHKMATNPIIRSITVQEEKNGMFQFLRVTAKDVDRKNELTEAWEELIYNEDPAVASLGKDLVKYAAYVSGMNQVGGAFFDLIPAGYLAETGFSEFIKREMDTLADPVGGVAYLAAFSDQFYQNNHEDQQIVPKLRSSEAKAYEKYSLKDAFTLDLGMGGARLRAGRTSNFKPYLTNTDGLLFKRIGYTMNNNPIYKRTEKLGFAGDRNSFKEYGTGVSAFNNVGFEEDIAVARDVPVKKQVASTAGVENMEDFSLKMNMLQKHFPSSLKFDRALNEIANVSQSADGPTITINPDKIQKDTIIHEYAHIYFAGLGGMQSEFIRRGVDQLIGSPIWAEVKEKYPQLSGDALAEEVLVTAIGRAGAKLFEAQKNRSAWQNWVSELWAKIKSVFGIKPSVAQVLAQEMLSEQITREYNGNNFQGTKYQVGEDTRQDFLEEETSQLDQIVIQLKERLDVKMQQAGRFVISGTNRSDIQKKRASVIADLKAFTKHIADVEGVQAISTYVTKAVSETKKITTALTNKIADGTLNVDNLQHVKSYVNTFDNIPMIEAFLEDFAFPDTEEGKEEKASLLKDIAQVESNRKQVERLYEKHKVSVLAKELLAETHLVRDGKRDKLRAEYQKQYKRPRKQKDLTTWQDIRDSWVNERMAENSEVYEKEELAELEETLRKSHFDIGMLEAWTMDPRAISDQLVQIGTKMADKADFATQVDFLGDARAGTKKYKAAIKSDVLWANKFEEQKEFLDPGNRLLPLEAAASMTKEKGDYLRMLHDLFEKGDEALPEHFKLATVNSKGQVIYKLPSIRKSTMEKIMENGAKSTIKEWWAESTTLQGDETDRGQITQDENGNAITEGEAQDNARDAAFAKNFSVAMADEKGELSKSIPIHFRNKLEAKDQSFDLTAIALSNLYMATNFKNKIGITPKLELLHDAMKTRKVAQRSGTGLLQFIKSSVSKKGGASLISKSEGSSMALKAFEGMLDQRLYGVSVRSAGKIFGKDVAQMSSSFQGYAGNLMLIANMPSAVANLLQGHIGSFLEASAGQYMNRADLAKAGIEYGKDLVNIVNDSAKLEYEKTSKVNMLLQNFDVMGDFSGMSNSMMKDSAFKAYASKDILHLSSMAEHNIQGTLMIGLMNNIKAIGQDGKYLTATGSTDKKSEALSMWDVYTVNEGQLELDPRVVTNTRNRELTTWESKNQEFEMAHLIKFINAEVNGNYDPKNKALIQTYAAGQQVMMLRKWIPRGVKARMQGISTAKGKLMADRDSKDYMRTGYNETTREVGEGRYTTFVNYMLSLVKEAEFKKFQFNSANKTTREKLTDSERANMAKAVPELAIMALLGVAASFLANMAEDDDEDQFKWFMAYMMKRTQGELTFFINPMEVLKTIDTPAVALKTLAQTVNMLSYVITPWELGDKYESGKNAGEFKAWIKAKKTVWPGQILNQFERDYKQSYQFQKDSGSRL